MRCGHTSSAAVGIGAAALVATGPRAYFAHRHRSSLVGFPTLIKLRRRQSRPRSGSDSGAPANIRSCRGEVVAHTRKCRLCLTEAGPIGSSDVAARRRRWLVAVLPGPAHEDGCQDRVERGKRVRRLAAIRPRDIPVTRVDRMVRREQAIGEDCDASGQRSFQWVCELARR